MRKFTLALAATTALTLAAGAATAQEWRSVDSRQAEIDTQIDAGVRRGDLTRVEAQALRTEFNAIANLEARYRIDGRISYTERDDLNRRMNVLTTRVSVQRRDDDRSWYGGRNWTDNRGRWVTIDQRQAQLDRRIDQGIRSRQLTRSEAVQLRSEFNAIARMEARYRMNGLSGWEQADLNRRFDVLAARVRAERTDGNRRYGYNDAPRY